MAGEASEECTQRFHRGSGGGMCAQGDRGNTGSPLGWPADVTGQRGIREDRTRPHGVADGLV